MIAPTDQHGGQAAPDDDVDRALDDLRRRVRQLEAEGRAAEGAALFFAELDAKKTIHDPDGGSLVVEDHVRQMGAVLFFAEISGDQPPAPGNAA